MTIKHNHTHNTAPRRLHIHDVAAILINTPHGEAAWVPDQPATVIISDGFAEVTIGADTRVVNAGGFLELLNADALAARGAERVVDEPWG